MSEAQSEGVSEFDLAMKQQQDALIEYRKAADAVKPDAHSTYPVTRQYDPEASKRIDRAEAVIDARRALDVADAHLTDVANEEYQKPDSPAE